MYICCALHKPDGGILIDTYLFLRTPTMHNDLIFHLDAETRQRLATYGELLKKDTSTMLNEALEQYFEAKDEELARQDPMTNLSYDEFWDDLDI